MGIAQNAQVAELGIAKQTAEDSAAANPTYALPVFEGLPSPMQSINPIPVTDTASTIPAIYKSEAHWEFNGTVPGLPQSLGTFLKGIFPTDTTTGAGDPYSHTFDLSGTTPWFTVWSRRPGDLYEKFSNGLVREIRIEFAEGEIVRVGVSMVGKSSEVLGSTYTAGTTETVTSTGEYLKSIGATLKLDLDATPAVTTVTNIASGTIRITRPTEIVATADSLTPVYFNRGPIEIGVVLDTVWQDYEAYQATFYGATNGTSQSATVVEGAIDFDFNFNGSANHDLVVTVPKVALLVPEAPQPDAGGSPLRVGIDGMGLRPSSGDPVTAVLRNAVSASY